MKDFKRLLVQVVSLAREMGMVQLGRLGIDGTKVRANASRRKAMSYGRMRERERQLREEIDELLKKASGRTGRKIPATGKTGGETSCPRSCGGAEDRLAAIEAAKQRLEAAQREADDERGRQPGQRNPKGGNPTSGPTGKWRRRRRATSPTRRAGS